MFAKLRGQVLLAEDNENIQRLITLYLTKMGIQVSHAENGAVAVTLAQEGNFDLILMDMQMPVLAGVDAVLELRDNGYRKPIVALTANATHEDRRQCLEAGCQDFLSKPVTRERLYHMLSQYLTPVAPLADLEPLHSTLSGQGPEFAEIVSHFITKLPGMIAVLEAAYRAQDWDKFREAVHNLKGMGGGFGFPQLTERAAEIEKLLKQEELASIAPVLGVLQSLVEQIQAGLPKLITQQVQQLS